MGELARWASSLCNSTRYRQGGPVPNVLHLSIAFDSG